MSSKFLSLIYISSNLYLLNISNRTAPPPIKISAYLLIVFPNSTGYNLFIFLNKTCFNGLYRVNKKGEFNVPMGAYKNPKICDKENLKNVAMALKNVKIVYADYRESKDFIDEKTFVYIDPPYRPLNLTSSFTSYTENDFSDKEQIELAEYIDVLNKKGAKIVMSNSDPKNNNTDDNFFDELYKNYNINRVKATRMLNSNASLRGAINELLITNYK